MANVIGFTGGGAGTTTNTGRMFVALKPLEERKVSADQVIAGLRPKLAQVPGATLFCRRRRTARRRPAEQCAVSVHASERQPGGSEHDGAQAAATNAEDSPSLTDVNSDQQNSGLQASLVIDRATASRLGITPQMIDNTLYDAFGQRQVSTMYTPLNQYHVVMEVEPQFWQSPKALTTSMSRRNSGVRFRSARSRTTSHRQRRSL